MHTPALLVPFVLGPAAFLILIPFAPVVIFAERRRDEYTTHH